MNHQDTNNYKVNTILHLHNILITSIINKARNQCNNRNIKCKTNNNRRKVSIINNKTNTVNKLADHSIIKVINSKHSHNNNHLIPTNKQLMLKVLIRIKMSYEKNSIFFVCIFILCMFIYSLYIKLIHF